MEYKVNLAGMRVWVTRPKPLGDALSALIDKCNGQAIYFPTIDIEPIPIPSWDLTSFDWIIFISPQAVLQYLARKVKLPPSLKIAAIGAGTAQVLRDANIPVDVFPKEDWHSEGLLQLPEFQTVKNQKIAIISGQGGRATLMDELSKRGAIVSKIEIYRRVLPKVSQLPEKVDVIVCTSNESVTHLKKLTSDQKILTTPLIVISERMQIHAREAGFQKIFLANNASHHAILDALEQVKGVMMDTPSQRRFFPWKTIGILCSALSVVILIFVFYLAYYSLLFTSKNLLTRVSAMQQNMQHLQEVISNTAQQTQRWNAEIKAQAQALSALQQAQDNNKNTLTLLEVQQWVKRANDNVQFENNIPTAIVLLKNADQALREANDSQFNSLRQAIAEDITALQAVPQVDVVGIYTRLTALSEQVTKLPLPNNLINTKPQSLVDNTLPWWKRSLQQTWQELQKIVVVRYNPSGSLPLMTPEQQNFLYQNMQAILEKAMWALLHKQSDVYHLSLQQAIDWTKKYFVPNAQATESMLNNLQELQQTNINPSAPNTLSAVSALQESFPKAGEV